ncbi:hypothetical protein SDC9_196527 [bioreactor metagenome]|uniref:Uncharacterized protein n=1 Tax=bioreactor metagenome TaxID=1076179 RepID=A0A645IKR9_9ZZZZ
MVAHIHLGATLLVAQRDHRTDIILRQEDGCGDDGLTDLGKLARLGQLGGVLDVQDLAVIQHHLVHHRWCGGDEIHVELALQPFLHDVHVQQAEEATAKTEAQRLRYFGFELQRCIIQAQLFQRITQLVVLARLHRIQAGKHLRLDFLEPR